MAGTLAYFAVGKSAASLPSGVLAAGAAFPGAIRLLNSIIALPAPIRACGSHRARARSRRFTPGVAFLQLHLEH